MKLWHLSRFPRFKSRTYRTYLIGTSIRSQIHGSSSIPSFCNHVPHLLQDEGHPLFWDTETRVYQSLPGCGLHQNQNQEQKTQKQSLSKKKTSAISILIRIYIYIYGYPKHLQTSRWGFCHHGSHGFSPAPDESPPQPPLQSRGSPTACPTRRSDARAPWKNMQMFLLRLRWREGKESIMPLQKNKIYL